MPDKGDKLYHGYKPVYRDAVDVIKAADPKTLSAVHELLFSGYCPELCDTPDRLCKGNQSGMFVFSALLRDTISERRVA